jgi:hypothetical protein
MIYHSDDITRLNLCAERAAVKPVLRYGVGVYVDTDPDVCGADFVIDPEDQGGLKIFREFAAKMAAHYKTLK